MTAYKQVRQYGSKSALTQALKDKPDLCVHFRTRLFALLLTWLASFLKADEQRARQRSFAAVSAGRPSSLIQSLLAH